jgi:hypothetical protein
LVPNSSNVRATMSAPLIVSAMAGVSFLCGVRFSNSGA